MSGTRARAWVTAALATLLAAGAAGAPPDRAGDLSSLVDEFVAHRLARAPYVARRAGFVEDLVAPAVAAHALDAERAWIAGFRARIEALPAGSDDREDQRRLLAAAVEHDSLELWVLRPFERDPGAYLPLIAGSVEAAMNRTTVSSCDRVKLAIHRLREVPEVLRAARVNVRNPPRVLTERAIERFEAALRFYRRDLPRVAMGCRSPFLQADLAEADTAAIRAVEGFLAGIEADLLPASQGDLAIGAPACRRLIASTLMAEVAPVDSLLADGTRELDASRAAVDSLARLVTDAGTAAALDSLAPTELALRDPAGVGLNAVEHLLGFLRAGDLVTIPAKFAVNVRRARPIHDLDGVRLADVDAGEPRIGPGWLEIAPADSGDLVAANETPGRWERDIAVAGEGVPGRLLRGQGTHAPAARLGRAMADVWNGGEWARYCERMVVDLGYGSADPRFRLALAVRALRQAGRSLASLALHAGTMSPEEARRMLEDRCLLTPARAEREMRWAASDAALMGYTIGAQRLLELQEEASRRLGPRFGTRSFNDALLRCGVAPYGYVRTRIWRELAVAAGNDPVGAKP